MAETGKLSLLRGFLDSLGFELEDEDSCLRARRVVAGEELKLCFCPAQAASEDEVRLAIRTLNKAARAELGLSTWLITREPLDSTRKQQAEDAGVNVETEVGYLNAAVQRERTCKDSIREAGAYIPEAEYVEQRIMPENQAASHYLMRWMNSPEGGLLVILGHAGYGKTCLSHELARRLAKSCLKEAASPVPFVLPLQKHRYVRRFEELVLTHLQDRGIHGFTSRAFAYLANHKRVLPILDGFDELAETGGLRVARETLKGLIEQLGDNAKVIVTSRQAYFRHRGDLSLMGDLNGFLATLQTRELAPFDHAERRLFLEKRGLDQKQAREVENAVQGLAAEDLLGSPLMLRIVADEVKQGERPVGETATEVFQKSLVKVCEREVPKLKVAWPPPKQLEFLAGIADLMNEEQAYELTDPDGWLSLVVEGDVSPEIPQPRRKEELLARATQLKNHPLLTPVTSDGKDAIAFPHPLYRDYFVAVMFKLSRTDESGLRRSLRAALPDGSVKFLAQMLRDPELVEIAEKSIAWKDGIRGVFEIALAKCDLASKNDTGVRSKQFTSCVGGRLQLDYQNLSGLNFAMLEFDSFSFVGADFTRCSFQACRFKNCRFDGSRLSGCRFYECEADAATASALRNLGVEAVSIPRLLGGSRMAVATPEVDPVAELAGRFFHRFIREERGRNQRTARVESFFSGQGGEERKFTDREIIPAMQKAGVISFKEAGVGVYMFNPEWQADGDALIFDKRETDKLRPILDRLRERAARYNLL